MDAITHLHVGALFAIALGPDAGLLAFLAIAFAVLPDVDTLTWAFPRLRRYLQHRGATHSLLFGAAASALAAGALSLGGWVAFPAAFLVAFVAFLTHVALDVLNWGCLLLWPFRSTRIEHTIHGGFTWSAGLSAASLAVMVVLWTQATHLLAVFASVVAIAFIGYLLLRLSLRQAFSRRHPGHRLLPTANPLVWVAAGAALDESEPQV